MDDLLPLSKGAVDGLKGLFVALALVAVVLRLVANWKYNRRLLVDDYISIAAIPFLISVAVLSDVAGNGFHDPTIPPHKVAQLAVAISVVTPLGLWTSKAPILFLYLRLFGIKKWLRVISYITLAVTAAVYIAGIVAIPPACTPHSTELSKPFIAGCQTRTRIINVFTGSFSVLADVVILVLPLPVVFGLTLLVRSKVGLAFLFLSGLFAIAASVLSLWFKAVSLHRPGTSLALSILATITECSVALIVGCVPSLRVLWSKILHPSIKTMSSGNMLSTADPTTGNRTARGTSQYVVMGEGADGRTSESPKALVVSTSTEVHTTSEFIDYPLPHHSRNNNNKNKNNGQFAMPMMPQHQFPPHAYDVHHNNSGQQQRGRGGSGGDPIQPPFGVYAEAYALQTRENGVWGR